MKSWGRYNQQIIAAVKEAVKYTKIWQHVHMWSVKFTCKLLILHLVVYCTVWEGMLFVQQTHLTHCLWADVLLVFCQTQILSDFFFSHYTHLFRDLGFFFLNILYSKETVNQLLLHKYTDFSRSVLKCYFAKYFRLNSWKHRIAHRYGPRHHYEDALVLRFKLLHC